MLPELTATDLRPSMSGVRAQAVANDGHLLDDFLFRRCGDVLHVLNAPSPAATACLPIGARIAQELLHPDWRLTCPRNAASQNHRPASRHRCGLRPSTGERPHLGQLRR